MTDELVVDRDWAEIPYFRKWWFVVVLFLVFTPGSLLVMWTGDTYYRKQGMIYRTSRKRKVTMTLVGVMLMVSFLVRRIH